jgi:serine-type D-Ala-D-Ala carboxypeptidase
MRFTHLHDSAITRKGFQNLTRASALSTVDSNLLEVAFEEQDERFASTFSILQEAIVQQAFPAASIAVTQHGELIALKAFGKPVYEINSVAPPLPRSLRQGEGFDFPIIPDTLFDLASLTKVVATTTMAMILYERGLLDLESPVTGVVPEFLSHSSGDPDPRRSAITFRMLLSHSSGLPAHEKFYLQAKSRADLLRAVFTVPLTADPATRAEYSDIGFIVLGIALERIAEERLDIFCQREIFGPLGMTRTMFNPTAEMRGKIPPTADERDDREYNLRSTFRNRIIQGEVQDENAFVLGGIAPHAGLFSTAEDLARFAHTMLQGGNPILRSETVALFTHRELTPEGTSRALGWDTPSSPSQSGNHFGPASFGHLGYTGTSLWINPARKLSITLLTNRTWPDCSNLAIKQVRPKFHDAVIEALGAAL